MQSGCKSRGNLTERQIFTQDIPDFILHFPLFVLLIKMFRDIQEQESYNWCGKNWSGGRQGPIIPQNPAAPIDSVDECCMAHDYCYAKYECDTCPSGSRGKDGKKECDQVLVSCLDALKNQPPQNWPKPPRPGNEADAYFFCQKAKFYWVFAT